MTEHARVLIVDDSRIFRSVLEEALTGQEGIAVAGSVFSGAKALEFLQATPPDMVTLDVEMPGLDGLETLEAIQRFNAGRPPQHEIGVIMVSAFTKRGADVTVRALQAGAFDFVTKPNAASEQENLALLREQLVSKIRLFVARRAVRQPAVPPSTTRAAPSGTATPPRRPGRKLVRAVVVAASTGGPRALGTLLPELCRRVSLPVLIVQHMPAPFTLSLAENLARQTGLTVVEATEGEPVRPRTVYIAPGGKHLVLRRSGDEVRMALNEQPPENCFRPSADVLFRSVAAVFGGDVVAVMLTGMDCGSPDGTAGLRPVKRAGGYIIAQDEATSVSWGMPGSVVRAGLADEVLPLQEIAAAVGSLVAGREAS
jgi:two-component system chemotaxis response regulator CheB